MKLTATLTPAQIHVEVRLLRGAFDRLRVDAVMTAVSALVFGGVAWRLFPLTPLILWAISFAVNVAASVVLIAAYRRRGVDNNERSLRRWQGLLALQLALAGMCWSVGPMLMIGNASGPYVALFVSILLVAAAVATNSLAEQQWALRAFLVTALLPTAFMCMWLGGSGMHLLAALLTASTVAMAVVGRGSHHATRALVQTEVRLQAALSLADVARLDAEHARAEADLARVEAEQACGRAEAASAAKTRFLATMSHELRTPLNAVIGGAELLRLEQAAGGSSQAQRIDAIQSSGKNLLGLIENILDLSRIEHGEMPLHPEDFDLAACLQQPLTAAALLAQVKGLRLSLHIDAALPTWRRGDVQRLRQVVLNLLGNAVKFTDHGEVSLRVEALQQGSNEANAFEPDTWVRLSVKDSGVGISADALAHIFDPFHQADQGSNRRFGGSGLGLAIVRLWVQAMGGRVSAVSGLGQGATFIVELPLPVCDPQNQAQNEVQDQAWVQARVQNTSRQQPLAGTVELAPKRSEHARSLDSGVLGEPARRASDKPQRRAQPGQHILVVEDDELNQAIVCGLLQHAGHCVSVASSGEQALATLAEANSIDMVLMDWQMPDMDGLEVTRRLRAGQAGAMGQRVPIVALTANAFAEDRAACLAAGMNDFLSKPVLLADLLAAVSRQADKNLAGAAPKTSVVAKPFADRGVESPTAVAFNPEVLAALPMVLDGSAPDYADELLVMFAQSAADALRKIQAAVQSADKPVLQRHLHSLKSSSASVGAMALATHCAAGEAALRKGSVPHSNLWALLVQCLDEFESAVQAHRSVLSSQGRLEGSTV